MKEQLVHLSRIEDPAKRVQMLARKALLAEMREISRVAFGASWKDNFEYELWDFVARGGGECKLCVIPPEYASELRITSEMAGGGWWTAKNGDSRLLRWVPMDTWLEMYVAWQGGVAEGE